MSERTRPERRRATRSAPRTAQTKSRAAPARRPAKQSRPAARSRGAGFLDYLIISLLVVLVLMIVAGVLIILRGGL